MSEDTQVTRDNLNDVMQFDHVIQVHEDGTVSQTDVYAPGLYDGVLEGDGWTLMNGYSGQYGYAGPIMHASEYIGGSLADDILSTPGLYVALADTPLDEEESDGWAVARKDAP